MARNGEVEYVFGRAGDRPVAGKKVAGLFDDEGNQIYRRWARDGDGSFSRGEDGRRYWEDFVMIDGEEQLLEASSSESDSDAEGDTRTRTRHVIDRGVAEEAYLERERKRQQQRVQLQRIIENESATNRTAREKAREVKLEEARKNRAMLSNARALEREQAHRVRVEEMSLLAQEQAKRRANERLEAKRKQAEQAAAASAEAARIRERLIQEQERKQPVHDEKQTQQCSSCHTVRQLSSFHQDGASYQTCVVCRLAVARYAEKNREMIRAKRLLRYSCAERYTCGCGSSVLNLSRSMHEKTKKHRGWLRVAAAPGGQGGVPGAAID